MRRTKSGAVPVIKLILPFPPSINHYYARNRNGSVRLGNAGRAYRLEVALKCRQARIKPLLGPLAMLIEAYPPDKRRRDLDNLLKAVLDALQHGGAYADDSQITDLTIRRGLALSCNPHVIVKVNALS